jgi:hypothetical protein
MLVAMPVGPTSAHSRAIWLQSAPDCWRPGTLDRAAFTQQATALSQQANFMQAAKRFAEQLLGSYGGDAELNRVMREHSRFAFVAFVFFLHHQRNAPHKRVNATGAETTAKGLTYGGLVELFALGAHTKAGQLATQTRIKAMIGLALVSGQLERMQVAGDRRQRHLAPTEKLIVATKVWLGGTLDAVHGVIELAAAPAEMLAQPLFLGEVLSYQVLAYCHDGFTLHEEFPAVRYFMGRESGYMTLMKILQTLRFEADQWVCSAPSQQLSEDFESARGTIRNVLSEAERQSWIVSSSRGGHRLVLSQRFARECLQWAAAELVWIAGLSNAAWRQIQAA